MDKQIIKLDFDKLTKLDSDKLLEVSGGMEDDIGSSWARGVRPIDPKSGKQEEKESNSADNSGMKTLDNNAEED